MTQRFVPHLCDVTFCNMLNKRKLARPHLDFTRMQIGFGRQILSYVRLKHSRRMLAPHQHSGRSSCKPRFDCTIASFVIVSKLGSLTSKNVLFARGPAFYLSFGMINVFVLSGLFTRKPRCLTGWFAWVAGTWPRQLDFRNTFVLNGPIF
jgi:hypothetical protein